MLILSMGCYHVYLRFNEAQVLLVAIVIVIILQVVFIFDCFEWVSVTPSGISLHSLIRKRKTILWAEVCCCGYFYHYIYIGIKRKFFYISKKPLQGGIDALGLRSMPLPTKDFIYVAEQRDVEAVIKQFYPKFMRK
jgi:hypothetical protein